MSMHRSVPAVLVLGLSLATVAAAQSTEWQAVESLLGDWTGEGGGAPGEATGGFSFTPDLQKQVIVRRNWAEYPATKDKPASRHDDLMIVYRDAGQKVRAEYFDNEGHVIHYQVQTSAGGKQVVFLSDPTPNEPRFRLTNTLIDGQRMSIKFEIAPPGKGDQFALYLQATARRK